MSARRTIQLLVVAAVIATGCADDVEPGAGPTTTTTVGPAETSDEITDTTTTAAAGDGSTPAWVDGDSDHLFDQDVVHTFELTLDDEALAFLDGDPTAEEWVEGELTFEGETVGPVGIRYKGSIGAWFGCVGSGGFLATGPKTCTKLSMKVKVNWDDPDREFGERWRRRRESRRWRRGSRHFRGTSVPGAAADAGRPQPNRQARQPRRCRGRGGQRQVVAARVARRGYWLRRRAGERGRRAQPDARQRRGRAEHGVSTRTCAQPVRSKYG